MPPTATFTENYHTHVARCHHAQGNVLDYALAARDAGVKILGISDHTPLPHGRWSHVRMEMKELGDYFDEVEAAKVQVPEVHLLTALECEYAPEFEEFYREELLPHCDYLLGGTHWFFRDEGWHGLHYKSSTEEDFLAYADTIIASMQSGLFLFQAHPDLFAGACETWSPIAERCSRRILKAAEEIGMVLEINAYGIRKPWIETPEGKRPRYPWRHFWELAREYQVEVVINSDAHRPEDIIAEMDTAFAIARDCNLPLADMTTRLAAYQPLGHSQR
ncbi:MAG: histidinol-phosphatase [Planctomycetota bacterium]|jgi:histidinol-phosphatase (PHP family)